MEIIENYNQVVCQHTLLKPDLPSPVGALGLRGQLIPRMKWLPVALYKHCKPTGELRTSLLLSPTKQEEKKRERDALWFVVCVCISLCVVSSEKTLDI